MTETDQLIQDVEPSRAACRSDCQHSKEPELSGVSGPCSQRHFQRRWGNSVPASGELNVKCKRSGSLGGVLENAFSGESPD
jgi:hypothetical protein